MAGISDDVENLRVNRDDFMNALDEVHPAFGVSEEELQQVVQNGIVHYDKTVDVRFGCLRFKHCLNSITRNSYFPFLVLKVVLGMSHSLIRIC